MNLRVKESKEISTAVWWSYLLILLIYGCSRDECSLAKEQFIRHHKTYTESIYRGKHGASSPGLAESIAALEISKQKCNAPDLEIKDIVNEYVKNPKNCSNGDIWEMMYCKK